MVCVQFRDFELAGMASESGVDAKGGFLQEFMLYETYSNYYMVGYDATKTSWRVLKIDRLEPSELNIFEDSTIYSQQECFELLKRIEEGNKSTGGLKFVTSCYGIVGFIKFLEPYYMLLITKRRAVGVICGHTVYAVAESQMIALPNSRVQSNIANSKNENRYKKLLCSVDLTKDFFFSYSYHITHSLQKNVCGNQKDQIYETMFVWNEFLTRETRNRLKSTLWTVTLIYGFFKQAKLSVSGKSFWLTLVARRSRHYAGTRYLKRGVNEEGRVANDVETEQIIFEDIPGELPSLVSSVIQNRGSIPLFWSQETSKLNLKPDIILEKKDKDYEATKLHFEDLLNRYGNPTVILNLIKAEEKKPRESILLSEFSNAIHVINKELPNDNQLKFLHWDLHKHSRSKRKRVLALLGKVAESVLSTTGFFICEVTPALPLEATIIRTHHDNLDDSLENIGNADLSGGSEEDRFVGSDSTLQDIAEVEVSFRGLCSMKPLQLQRGVLRTNCIDCLDRTNVAQYAYGLAALGCQLHALGLIRVSRIALGTPLADELMRLYEKMGDILALQYGGSGAHNKIFSERRGQCKAAIQSQEFFRTMQRYYSNACMDAQKQAAINIFLGLLQPEQDNAAGWNLISDQHENLGNVGPTFINGNTGSLIKRSLSDGNMICESDTDTPLLICTAGHEELPMSGHLVREHNMGHVKVLSDSAPEISALGKDISYSRCTRITSQGKFFAESSHGYVYENADSNFLDLDWLFSSGNSSEGENCKSLFEKLSTENGMNSGPSLERPVIRVNGSDVMVKQAMEMQVGHDANQVPNTSRFPESFVQWVVHGEIL